MYSTHNEGNSVVDERFIGKIYIVGKYNNTYLSTIKMKSVDVTSGTYTDFVTENKDKYPKFKAGYHVRTSKYKNIFAKGYVSK